MNDVSTTLSFIAQSGTNLFYFLLRTSLKHWTTTIQAAMLTTALNTSFMIKPPLLITSDTDECDSNAHRNERMLMPPIVELC